MMTATLEQHHERDAEDEKLASRSDDLAAVQDLVSRYVGQLLYGCSESTCTEVTCATGRRNTSQKPVRDYKPRSARAIAITLASGPNPRRRLCSHRHSAAPDEKPAPGPRDHAAFVQQLSDSSSIQKVCHSSRELSGLRIPTRRSDESVYTQDYYDRLKDWNREIDGLAFFYNHSPLSPLLGLNQILDTNEATANELCECLRWLASYLPEATDQNWGMVNIDIQAGYSCPQMFHEPEHEERSESIRLADSLEHWPSFRLFCRVVELIRDIVTLEVRALREESNRDDDVLACNSQRLEILLGKRLVGDLSHFLMPMLIWTKKVFLCHWDGEIILPERSIATEALRLLRILKRAFGDDIKSNRKLYILIGLCAIPRRLDAVEVAKTYLENPRPEGGYHILSFSSLFAQSELATYFRTINHLRMRKAHSEAEKTAALRLRYDHMVFIGEPEQRLKWMEEHYLLLNISRQNVVEDAFNQLWQRRRGELLRPLRVRLGEANEFEIGHDLGGVQIEFFNLLWRELLKEEAQMFHTDSATGLTYFRQGSLQPLHMFQLCGMLFALAVYNGITLPINFPIAFYDHFTERRTVEPDIEDRWPHISRSLQSILTEEIPGLEAVFPFEANGLRLSVLAPETSPKPSQEDGRISLYVTEVSRVVHHNQSSKPPTENQPSTSLPEINLSELETAWPGWRLLPTTTPPPELTPSNKRPYVKNYKTWLTETSVAPQLTAFKNGFTNILPPDLTSLLPAPNLRRLVEGTTTFSITDLQSSTTYENYDPASKYIRLFWRVVTAWPETKQRALLKFVTAIERLPALGGGGDVGTNGNGNGNFTMKIERPRPDDPSRLPTSSTCFRTLFLPKYPTAEALERMLGVAIEFGGEGFGTG